jgi:hypothetical protein
MARSGIGGGEFLVLATLAWLAAAGVALAWLSSPPASGSSSDVRSVIVSRPAADPSE